MASIKEMKAFGQQINLTLLNDIISFTASVANASDEQRNELTRRCILLDTTLRGGDTFQEKYRFLYLGELLERYEERFGMSDQDRRAIALALGYTKDIVTDEMFVGNQRVAFLQEMRRHLDHDIYLIGAFYLLNEGQSSEGDWSERLYAHPYEKTEELIFAMSLYTDFEHSFLQFKTHLVRLMGRERTLEFQGNAWILNWTISKLQPVIKTVRGKDLTLLRALCALPATYVKQGSKHHDVLLTHGYTPFEIVYANMMSVWGQTAQNTLRLDSIVTEKIVVDLFQQVMEQSTSLEQEAYTQLSNIFLWYEEFPIRCYGHSKLLEALCESTPIQNAETLIWFSNRAPIEHPAFAAFDILNPKWDIVTPDRLKQKYLKLFETNLKREMEKDEIQERINRYDSLTGTSYIDVFQARHYGDQFSLLVETGILDLWELFQRCLDETGEISVPELLKNIKSYVQGLKTLQAFEFLQRLLSQYGFDGYQKYLYPYSDDFLSGIISFTGYSGKSEVHMSLDRDYFKENSTGPTTLLQWAEEYIFQYMPSAYLSFIFGLLKSENATALFPQDDLRSLLEQLIGWKTLNDYDTMQLKKRYWMPDELKADQDAREAAKQAADEERRLNDRQVIQEKYERYVNESIKSLREFMKLYPYTNYQKNFACQLVRKNLPQFLEKRHYMLDKEEMGDFFYICARLIKFRSWSLADAQDVISKIKEVHVNDTTDVANK